MTPCPEYRRLEIDRAIRKDLLLGKAVPACALAAASDCVVHRRRRTDNVIDRRGDLRRTALRARRRLDRNLDLDCDVWKNVGFALRRHGDRPRHGEYSRL